jgi:dimethylargininase
MLFDTVITRPPGKNYVNCVSPYPEKSTLRLSSAIEQYESFVRILRDNGINIIELPPLNDHPDSVFMQDVAITGLKSRTALLSRFGEPSRRGEENDESLLKILKDLGLEIRHVTEPGTLEGGDFIITDVDNIVLAGISPRTNNDGIRQFKDAFKDAEVISIPVRKFIHLGSVMKYLDNGNLVISPGIINDNYLQLLKTKGFNLIPLLEDLGYKKSSTEFTAYLMYIGNDKVIIPPDNRKTIRQLSELGYDVIELDFSEFWKCNGSYMCLTQPLYKTL